MDCFIYMKLNGTSFTKLTCYETEQTMSLRFQKPYGKGRSVLDNFSDSIYFINTNTYQALHNDLRINQNRLKYFISRLQSITRSKPSDENEELKKEIREKIGLQIDKVKQSKREIRQYRLLNNFSHKTKTVSRRKTLERIVYLEQLKYRIENDRENEDEELAEMIVNKLDELIDDLKDDIEIEVEDDENF